MTTFERAVVTWKPGGGNVVVVGTSVSVRAYVMRHSLFTQKWIALTNLVWAESEEGKTQFLTSPTFDRKREAMAWFERLCDVGLFLTTVEVDVKDGGT